MADGDTLPEGLGEAVREILPVAVDDSDTVVDTLADMLEDTLVDIDGVTDCDGTHARPS